MGSLSKAPLLPFSGSSSAPAPTSAIAGVRGSFERLFWKRSSSGAGGDGGNGAHRDEEAEVGSIGKRSSKRISVDDLGDGPSGGGVVMEMGRIAEFSQFEVGEGWKERNRSRVGDVHEDEEEFDAEGHVRERRNSFFEREQMGKD
ncbi:hypothetical protein FRC03_001760 [Tulasnella sp. 419]|nr:hypothetical protein FRC03_001760 [Tulasnella sp. 419]